MIGRKSVRALAVAMIALLAIAVPASAQTTTGTVAGTVKDAQGGVIPGATVTLVSASARHRTSPVVTSATGDFVFPNVAADTYTIEVSMAAFKTLKRSGVVGQPGHARGRWRPDDRGRRHGRDGRRQRRGAAIQAQSGERSFTVATDVGREPADRQSQLHRARRACARRRRQQPHRRRRRQQHHDGRRLDDGHRQQLASCCR